MNMNRKFVITNSGGVNLTPEIDDDDVYMDNLTWDSREVRSGSLFLAMPGERVDGNDYVVPAINAGAKCVLVTRTPDPATLAVAGEFDCAVIQVGDPLAALRSMASVDTLVTSARIVGVTGSTGKTTTKDLIASVLSQSLETVATKGNHNNELGVPATILGIDEHTEALVVEMGMRGRGQITAMCDYVRPSIGVITNVGVTHMELLGSQDNIALAKGELISALPDNGVAVLNGDDPYTGFILEHCAHASSLKVITFGLSEGCDMRATEVHLGTDALPGFNITFPDGAMRMVSLKLPGSHNVYNALAAAAVGFSCGLGHEAIAAGLAAARSGAMRLQTEQASCGATLINDAYNANPDSMRAALSTLQRMDVKGRRIAVLGDMGELGEGEEGFHREVGTFAAGTGLDFLVCVGPLSRAMAEAAVEAGMAQDAVETCDCVEQAVALLSSMLGSDDVVLVKASRSMGLERVVKGLVN